MCEFYLCESLAVSGCINLYCTISVLHSNYTSWLRPCVSARYGHLFEAQDFALQSVFFNTLYHGCWFASFYGLLGNRQLGDTVTVSKYSHYSICAWAPPLIESWQYSTSQRCAHEPRPSMKVDSTALHSNVLKICNGCSLSRRVSLRDNLLQGTARWTQRPRDTAAGAMDKRHRETVIMQINYWDLQAIINYR